MSTKSKKVKKSTRKRLAIMAPGLTKKELGNLRTQVELSMVDPSYVIITNYEFSFMEIPM